MTAKKRRESTGRRAAIAVAAAAALTGLLAACGHSGGGTASHPPAGTQSAPATAPTGTATDHSPGHGHGTSTSTSTSTHMISNRGHRLAFHVTPGHRPVIVLDAGGGQDSSYWKTIVPDLAKRTGSEVITYDRAGMGASDPVPGPWQARNAVSDLEAGLTALGATHHVILVSHSEAGEIATYITARYPGQFAGAVLVDAALPQFSTDAEIARVSAATQARVQAIKAKDSTTLSKAERQLLAVAASYVPDQRAYHRAVWPIAVPATVIVSGQTPFPTSPPDAEAWRAAQRQFAAQAPNRHLVTAAGSSHDIPLDRPELVEAEITAMADAAG